MPMQWPSSLKRGSAADRLLELQDIITPAVSTKLVLARNLALTDTWT